MPATELPPENENPLATVTAITPGTYVYALMPSEGASKNWSAGELERVDVRTYVARIALTVLLPNTCVSPKAVVWARLRLFGPKMFLTARTSCVRARVGGRRSKWSRYRPKTEWLAVS